MRKLTGIHLGSYWMGENDVVFLMAHDLSTLCHLTIIDTEIYTGKPSTWYREDPRHNPDNPVRWLDHDRVMATVDGCAADFVIVNSGGMSLTQRTIDALRKRGVVSVGISLSDPDVFPYHGRVYSQLSDLYYTNSLYSLEYQYGRCSGTSLLPFAASERLHRPIPEMEKIYDVIVVGHARPDRIKVVNELQRVCSVGLFGSGWGPEWKSVHGEDHVRALNSGRMYLSFATTTAGFVNVKSGLFEAAATRTLLVSNWFPEMERYFLYGLEVVGFSSVSQLLSLVGYYRHHSPVRDWIADNSYRRCLAEHTWCRRWGSVLSDIRLLSKSRENVGLC